MKKNTQYLFVISLDALVTTDFDYIKTLPTFSYLIGNGSTVKNLETVYPSVTYTCHTSIITGTYPNKHGIYTNEIMNTKRPNAQDWFWFEKDIKVPTIFDYTKQNNLKSSAILWPVMVGAPIDYNCPEIWSETGESYFKLYKKYASKSLFPLILKHSIKTKGKKQPYLDNFVEGIFKDILIKKNPNIICSHFIALDKYRHLYGSSSSPSRDMLNLFDLRLSRIIALTKQLGIFDNSTFFIFGDHGSNDYEHYIELNTYFKNSGYIKTDASNRIIDWICYASSCGGSAQVHVNPKYSNKSNDVYNELVTFSNTYDKCVDRLYTKDEVTAKYSLSGKFEFVIEAKNNYVFRNSLSDNIISDLDKNSLKSDHGYEPYKSMNSLMIAMGNKIEKGLCLDNASLVDLAPTFLKIFNIDMKKTDGNVIAAILKN